MEILKNVQTILGILFEHYKYVILFLTIVLTVFNVILNTFIRKKYSSQIDKNANQKG